MTLEVRPYEPGLRDDWNALNARADNGHFLFDRRFMEYHADRFIDASLVIMDGGAPAALLPANRKDDVAYSHQGLTFGGLVDVFDRSAARFEALNLMADRLKADGCATLIYKSLPWIYRGRPSEADLYWLHGRGARLKARHLTTSIDLARPGRRSSRRERGVKKAAKAGLTYARSSDWAGFWSLLQTVLDQRHGVRPVHDLAEIGLLASRFPDNISLHLATSASEILAGVVMFSTPLVAHAQYIAVGEAGRELGALDGLFDHLIRHQPADRRWFDFGVSTERGGDVLNEGLLTQKEEFGGGSVVHDIYEMEL